MKPLLLLALLLASPARADVTLGAVLSLTGSGAGLGVPACNTIELLPKTMAGEPVRWVVLDDGSDSTAVRAVRKLVEEERVDAILGPCTSPASVAVRADAAAQGIPIVAEARYAPATPASRRRCCGCRRPRPAPCSSPPALRPRPRRSSNCAPLGLPGRSAP